MIGRNGERRSGISAQAARQDDDDIHIFIHTYVLLTYIMYSLLSFTQAIKYVQLLFSFYSFLKVNGKSAAMILLQNGIPDAEYTPFWF